MKRTREEWAARRANIARHVERGRSQADVARLFDITPARVGQIVARVKRDAQRERCARGEHGETWTGAMEIHDAGSHRKITTTWCADCHAALSREEEPL